VDVRTEQPIATEPVVEERAALAAIHAASRATSGTGSQPSSMFGSA
jgi:hypothetical protein